MERGKQGKVSNKMKGTQVLKLFPIQKFPELKTRKSVFSFSFTDRSLKQAPSGYGWGGFLRRSRKMIKYPHGNQRKDKTG